MNTLINSSQAQLDTLASRVDTLESRVTKLGG
jgi:outer membrane murein-binding lipoprotein Lpp